MKNIDLKKLYPTKEKIEATMPQPDESDIQEEYVREEYKPSLILKEDINLKEYVKKIIKGTLRSNTNNINSSALEDGYNDGLKVKLRKGLKEENNNSERLFLN